MSGRGIFLQCSSLCRRTVWIVERKIVAHGPVCKDSGSVSAWGGVGESEFGCNFEVQFNAFSFLGGLVWSI